MLKRFKDGRGCKKGDTGSEGADRALGGLNRRMHRKREKGAGMVGGAAD